MQTNKSRGIASWPDRMRELRGPSHSFGVRLGRGRQKEWLLVSLTPKNVRDGG